MTQNTINGLTVLQKQEFESISKRVDELTTRNEQRIEKLTFDVTCINPPHELKLAGTSKRVEGVTKLQWKI